VTLTVAPLNGESVLGSTGDENNVSVDPLRGTPEYLKLNVFENPWHLIDLSSDENTRERSDCLQLNLFNIADGNQSSICY